MPTPTVTCDLCDAECRLDDCDGGLCPACHAQQEAAEERQAAIDEAEYEIEQAETEAETVPDVYPDEAPELPDAAYFDPADEDWAAIRDGSADDDIIDEIALWTVSEFEYQVIQAELDERYNTIG